MKFAEGYLNDVQYSTLK